MSDTYKTVIITNKARTLRHYIYNEEEFKAQILYNPAIVELIGFYNQQVKPCFDVDAYEKDVDVNEIIGIINKLFPDKQVNYGKRNPRLTDKGVMKYSYRFYVNGVRMTTKNLKLYLAQNGYTEDNSPFDLSIYQKNHILFLPLTTMKFKGKGEELIPVPTLTPVNCSIFDCCASYILEEFEDWDLKMPKNEPVIEMKKELCDDIAVAPVYNGDLNFTEIITKFSKERATNYGTWIFVGIALINLFHRKILTRGQVYDIFDLFSRKSDDYDANGVSNVIDTNISRFDGKGYGINYLLECLKEDDLEYYNFITKKCLMIDGSNDDIGASKIVVDHYKKSLIICNGVLYINHNNIWVGNEKQVDKLLIEMIGKLDIKFLGADGKKKYSYNTSIKHIKDCIVAIKANQSIINDQFYDDMIKNNKYYLPFNDGIYSFKEQKLYKYDELPNIHFTQKISRNFPKFNQQDHDDLMRRVLIPIYPNEEEHRYNAHVKARALAGCYEDKKWYGYSGSRNSGKGTETKLMRSAFGEYVLEFNAKCLIFNKFGNPEPAKALSWVVDKKDARIIISNEIDGDDNTKLNGAFIKSLASGGDAMEGRKLYENTVSFIPQFTMFLCYNKFYEVEPADAKENLEEFEYKSKFVQADELIEGVSFLKLTDETIKDFIKEDRIIDAYILHILSSFSNPRMKTPQCIKNSTEIGSGEIELTVEQYIMQNFRTTNDSKDRLHIEEITQILNNNNYKVDKILAGRLMNRMGIGKYNKNCNKNNIRTRGYDYIKFVGQNDEV